MTGFGAADGPVGGGRVRAEIRTVNHRHFNPSLKLPQEFAALEGALRERLRRDFDRGHVTVSVRWTEAPEREADGFTVDVDRARAVVAALTALKQTLGVPGEVDLAIVLRQPDVIVPAQREEPEASWAELEPVVSQAIAECKAMRRREGEVLAIELLHRLSAVRQC